MEKINIPKKIYYSLVVLMIVLILFLFVLMYYYNEHRKNIVEDLEAEGFFCNKNIFGFYTSCLKPENKFELNLDLVREEKWNS